MKVLEKIKNKLNELNLLDEMFLFSCSSLDKGGNLFTYKNEDDTINNNYYELTFIANKNKVSNKMTSRELLNFADIGFFCFRTFNNNKITYNEVFSTKLN